MVPDCEHPANDTVAEKPPATRAVKADPKIIDRWIADLDSDRFSVRQAAAKELEKVGDQVLAPIQKALQGTLSLEARQRLDLILNSLQTVPGPTALKTLRSITVLENIMTHPKRGGLLELLAQGAPEARETAEAKAALEWLGKR